MFRFLLVILIFTSTLGYSQSKIDSLKAILKNSTDKTAQLEVLDGLTKELINQNSEEQEVYIRAYLRLTSSLEEYDLMASKSRFLIQYFINKNNFDKASKLCDSLLGLKALFEKENSEAHLLLKRGQLYFLEENFDYAIKDYSLSKDLFLKSGDSIFAADAYFFVAQSYFNKNIFLEAIDNYKKAQHLYEILGDDTYALLVGSEITALYTKNGFFEKAIEERQHLLQKAKEQQDFVAQTQVIGQNVVDYYKLGDYDNMNKQLDIFSKLKDSINEKYFRYYYGLIAILYKIHYQCMQGNVEAASELMVQLEQEFTKTDLTEYLETDILIAKAAYFEMVDDEKRLFPILEKFSNIKTTTRLEDQIKARGKLAEIYQQKGQLEKVIELNAINAKVKDSIYNAQKTNAFLLYQSEFEAEQKQHQIKEQASMIKQLEVEQELTRNRRNTLIGGIITFFMIAIGFFYFRNRQKIKEQAYQNILLNNKVATKTEEINELLTETIQHIKSKERIAENLQKLSNEKEGITLKSIIADLKASKADHAKLLLIKQNIEQVNFEFIKKLKNLHPELSKTDIEICSLARIGLNRKEVANLRNTSVDAVRMSRIRIKKKLNLSANQSLDDYINTL
ncbi:MAG: hypothetical protein AAFX55_04040 [Bacteroidota bacterium]